MNTKDKEIIKCILHAIDENESAHFSAEWESRKISKTLYKNKRRYIEQAISLINGSKNSRIKYKIEKTGDQNGFTCFITYFVWKEAGEAVQASFHTPLGGGKYHRTPVLQKGCPDIKWSGFIGGNKALLKKIGDKYLK